VLALRGDLCLHAADSTGVVIVKIKIVLASLAANRTHAALPIVILFLGRHYSLHAAEDAGVIILGVEIVITYGGAY
jgi:hypothetical protein